MSEEKKVIELKEEDLEKVTGGTVSKSGVDDANLLFKLGDRFCKPDYQGNAVYYDIVDIYKKYNTCYFVLMNVDTCDTIDVITSQLQSSYTKIN